MNELQRVKRMNDLLLETIKNKDAEIVELYHRNIMLQWEINELKDRLEKLERTPIKIKYVGR